MWKHIASNALTVIIIGLFLIGGYVMVNMRRVQEPGPLTQAVCLRVEPGSTMREVAFKLKDMEAIRSAGLFRIAADYTDREQKLKAGSFLLEPGESMEEILEQITASGQSTCGTEIIYRIGVNAQRAEVRALDPETGEFKEVAKVEAGEEAPQAYLDAVEEPDARLRVAVAEGATSWQILNALNAIDTLESADMPVPAEGTLMPDSYEFSRGDNVAEIIGEMQAKSAAYLAEAWENRAADIPLETPEQALILASIIEKETGIAEERGQVASVFTNRLRRGMRLQTDPTVIYGITNGEGVLGRGLRQSELRAATPYNTYVIEGLPPGPIANPGRASIDAALNPEDTPYIFFVADGTGGHAFAETLEEHNQNVARWRAIEAENQ